MNQRIISLLQELNDLWPKSDLALFANNGLLVLTKCPSGRIIEYFGSVRCDGGDADILRIDGCDYIEQMSFCEQR